MAENPNARLEFFCDGVFAIAITLLIIEIKVPALENMHAMADVWIAVTHLWPSFLALLISFTIIFLSWYGHHRLMLALDKTSARFQFATGLFLLTVVVIPFPTAFMAEYLGTPYARPGIFIYCLGSLFHNLGWRAMVRSTLTPVQLTKSPEHLKIIKGVIKGNHIGLFISLGIVLISWWLPYVALSISILLWSFWLFMTLTTKMER